MSEFKKQYNPDRHSDWNYGGSKWRLSRSKIDFFLECPRCFYLDNKLGTKRPSFPAFNLNIAVDELFKKEFDEHRQAHTAHPIMSQYNIDAVPFAHKAMAAWRDPFVGIEYKEPETGLTISGGVDDIWVTPKDTLIIVDYKSTSKEGSITKLSDSPWDMQYTRQLGIYRWLLEKNDFVVEETGYLVYANARKDVAGFNNTLVFETTLVPVTTDTDWILPTLRDIKTCLDKDEIPKIGERCEFCPYREATGKKLQTMYYASKKAN
jgi:CRISPR/Cas system-associated exonuclease Cas4 (RecB family)